MPVRINLKELFGSDAQTIFTDKINYNFNKVIELGIGVQGQRGITGPEGSAGPAGNTGTPGQRGNKWFVGAGTPVGQTFPGIIDGDFYLDTDTSSIWQYAAGTDTWTEITDISQLIINLIDQIGSPFIRGLGETSPLDDRYILFPHRGNNTIARTDDTLLGNNSANDMLLLSNWNEGFLTIDNFPIDTDDLFNSLQNISVDHTIFPAGRYHLEFSSLYNDTQISPADIKLSDLKNNLKVRYLKDDVSGSPFFINTNHFINLGRFSISNPEQGYALTDIDQNSIFEFIVNKWNNEGMSPIQKQLTFKMGALEGIREYNTAITGIPIDGIQIDNGTPDNQAVGYGITDYFSDEPTYTQTVGALTVSSNLGGVMLPDPVFSMDTIYQIQEGSVVSIDFVDESSHATSGTHHNSSVYTDGSILIRVAGYASSDTTIGGPSYLFPGYFKMRDIGSGNTFFSTDQEINDSSHDTSCSRANGSNFDGIDQHGLRLSDIRAMDTQYLTFPLTCAKDVTIRGKYMYFIAGTPGINTPPTPPDMSIRSNLSIVEIDSNINRLQGVGFLEDTTYLWDAHRIQLSGDHAYTIEYASTTASPARPYFASIWVGDPRNPLTSDAVQPNLSAAGGSIINLLDFDIQGEEAYVVSLESDVAGTPGIWSLKMHTIDIHDPFVLGFVNSDINNPANDAGNTIAGGFTASYKEIRGAIKVIQNTAYVVFNKSLYTFKLTTNRTLPSGPPEGFVFQLVSTLDFEPLVSGTSTEFSVCDLLVSGNTLYVLGSYRDTEEGAILAVSILESHNPHFMSEAATSYNPSRMTISGQDIIVATSAHSGTGLGGGTQHFRTVGLESPGAHIGNIKSTNINVGNDIQISNSLQVGNSVNVGSGGLYVDRGRGITTDSSIRGTLTFEEHDTAPEYYIDGFGHRLTLTDASNIVDIGTGEGTQASISGNLTYISGIEQAVGATGALVYLDNHLNLQLIENWVQTDPLFLGTTDTFFNQTDVSNSDFLGNVTWQSLEYSATGQNSRTVKGIRINTGGTSDSDFMHLDLRHAMNCGAIHFINTEFDGDAGDAYTVFEHTGESTGSGNNTTGILLTYKGDIGGGSGRLNPGLHVYCGTSGTIEAGDVIGNEFAAQMDLFGVGDKLTVNDVFLHGYYDGGVVINDYRNFDVTTSVNTDLIANKMDLGQMTTSGTGYVYGNKFEREQFNQYEGESQLLGGAKIGSLDNSDPTANNNTSIVRQTDFFFAATKEAGGDIVPGSAVLGTPNGGNVLDASVSVASYTSNAYTLLIDFEVPWCPNPFNTGPFNDGQSILAPIVQVTLTNPLAAGIHLPPTNNTMVGDGMVDNDWIYCLKPYVTQIDSRGGATWFSVVVTTRSGSLLGGGTLGTNQVSWDDIINGVPTGVTPSAAWGNFAIAISIKWVRQYTNFP